MFTGTAYMHIARGLMIFAWETLTTSSCIQYIHASSTIYNMKN